MRYRIDLKYLGGWGNAEWTEEMAGIDKPMRFETVAQARAALEDFFGDVKQAVAAGNMDVEAARSDYRVALVTN